MPMLRNSTSSHSSRVNCTADFRIISNARTGLLNRFDDSIKTVVSIPYAGCRDWPIKSIIAQTPPTSSDELRYILFRNVNVLQAHVRQFCPILVLDKRARTFINDRRRAVRGSLLVGSAFIRRTNVPLKFASHGSALQPQCQVGGAIFAQQMFGYRQTLLNRTLRF